MHTSPLTEPHAHDSRTAPSPARWTALTGIGFVVCFIGSVVASSPPSNGASDRTWIANYSGSDKTQHVVTGVLLVAAALMVMSFLVGLWRRVAERSATRPSPLPIVAAGAGAAAIAIGGVVMGTAGAVITHHADPGVANLFRLANGLGFALVALAGMPAIGLGVACLSVQGRGAGVLSRGLSIFGVVAAVALVAALAFVPIALLLIWVLIVAVGWVRAAD